MVASEHLDSISHWSGFEVGFNLKNHLPGEISIQWFFKSGEGSFFFIKNPWAVLPTGLFLNLK
jgi:hypothetical protein